MESYSNLNLSWIDWTIVLIAVIGVRMVSWASRSLMRGVADFLSANRMAGRYLLTIAGTMGNTGVISMVGAWQAFTASGFAPGFWGFATAPLGIIFTLTGWVYYRLRETRALTVAQFLEMRYNRRFRIFAGTMCWLSGIINFGLFPAVAARFLIYFCGLPDYFSVLGLHVATYPAIMFVDLALALFFVNSGGQVSVMLTECAQGIVSTYACLAIAIAVILIIPWHDAVTAMQTSTAPDASMLNPFHTSGVKDFNAAFYIIGIIGSIYGANTWLGAQGFMTSARNPHEQKMGSIISMWRNLPYNIMVVVIPLAAFTVLHLPSFAGQAAAANHIVHTRISNTSIQSEMTIPVMISLMLPIGIKGLLAMVAVFLSFTCHDTYMHSWGSIFVQDVLIPIRNKPLEPAEHVRWLRYSIFFVAIFAFFFSLLYVETSAIQLFFAITGTIWLGGAGSIMIGGLYSRFGTTAGAYAAMICGSGIGIAEIIVTQIWKAHHTADFPINGQWMFLFSILLSVGLYIVVSAVTGGFGRPFNLEKMLHRGPYSVDAHEHEVKSERLPKWQQALGITREFSKGDKFLAFLMGAWNMGWFFTFIVIMVKNFALGGTDDRFWVNFWHFTLAWQVLVALPTTIWFTVGGYLDINALFKSLRTKIRDSTDDGRVIHSPEDYAPEPDPELVPAVPQDN